jgi:large subunit ribosomal protein L18
MLSNKHIHVQIVDDEAAATLVAVSTVGKGAAVKGKNMAAAKALGLAVAAKAKEKGIATVVFDRGGFKYHGRIKAIADAVREAGIKC